MPANVHCPNCRESNAATTRFCTACGAVLVENTPGGGRRRVLRPWGLRRSAPLTESPAMPDLAQARAAAMRANGTAPKRRFPMMLVCGLAIVGAAGVVAYPFTTPDVASPAEKIELATASELLVTIPATPTIRETTLAAPALIEPPPVLDAPKLKVLVQPPAEPAARQPAPPPAEVPIAVSEPPAAPVREAPAPVVERPIVTAPADRWEPLRTRLAACASVDGLFKRAMCEQGARIDHCNGYWGETPLCPVARTDYGG